MKFKNHRILIKLLIFIISSVLYFPIPSFASDFPAKEVYARYSPSVMVVRATDEKGEGSIGTGSIISDDGLIITNAHVIFDKEEDKPFPVIVVFTKPKKLIGVTKNELDKSYEVEILKYDVPLDLAILKIKNYDFKADIVALADPQEIEVGEDVIAIGHPEQGGFWTLTYGRISGEIKDFQGVPGKEMFQTDTSVNRGNSGGPLLDRRGYMVAVNSNIARLSSDGLPITGINFSIKSSVVRKWLSENGYEVAYGKKPLTAINEPVTSGAITKADENNAPSPGTAPIKSENAKIIPPPLNEVDAQAVIPPPLTGGGKGEGELRGFSSKPEKKFETPQTPYDYDAFLKEAEEDLKEMMKDMRQEIKRRKGR
ncbi:MAG: trypsin-like peptidase domain-containing protein [Nitrospirae bacterium]|nr:trypsin-like peptidase domain-containing protein [Nitrospirota bacterium]